MSWEIFSDITKVRVWPSKKQEIHSDQFTDDLQVVLRVGWCFLCAQLNINRDDGIHEQKARKVQVW